MQPFAFYVGTNENKKDDISKLKNDRKTDTKREGKRREGGGREKREGGETFSVKCFF